MLKWNEPKGPAPKWLDADREVTHDDPKLDRSAFIVACVDQLTTRGLTPAQAFEVTANALNETGWGQAYRANNLGGWKLTKAGAESYRKAHGIGPLWWRAPGNKAPGATLADLKGGDPPWCYYRAFESFGHYLAEWVDHFVPKPGGPIPYGIYKRTGELFWSGSPDWFRAMCLAGYKGANTQKRPDGAVAEHKQLSAAARTRWAQSKLHVASDGKWGPRSSAACEAFQTAHGLPATGQPDDSTCLALAAKHPA